MLIPATLEDEAVICEHVASPDWSPDDTRIAFVGEQYGPSRDPVRMSRLYVARADGSQLQLLGGAPATRERAPAWSPDGRRLALPARDASLPAAGCPAQPLGLCFWPHVMNADGSGRTLLTATVSLDAKPAWAPDGQRLAFVGAPIGGTAAEVGLYVIGVDGAGLRRVAPAPSGGAPAWNPTRP